MSDMYDRFYLEIKKTSKANLIRKRKEFMELLIKTLSDDDESSDAAASELNSKFGTKVIAKTNNGNTTKMFVDGVEEFRV